MTKRRMHILVGSAALIFGGLCYVLLRGDAWVTSVFSCVPVLNRIRQVFEPFKLDFLRYYFPDFLWALSLCCYLHAIHTPGKWGSVFCAGAAFICGGVWELLQHVGMVSGTGDLLDLGLYLLASIASIIINL